MKTELLLMKFDNQTQAIKFLFEKGNAFVIEKFFDSPKVIIEKKGYDVRIYDKKGEEISNYLLNTVTALRQIYVGDYKLDCVLIQLNGKTQIPENKINLKESNKVFSKIYVSDILFLDEDTSKQPWFERKKLFKKLKFNEKVTESPFVVVATEAEAKKAIQIMSSLKGSKGATIKEYKPKNITNPTCFYLRKDNE